MHHRVLRANRLPARPAPPEEPFLRGVLRDAQTRLRVQPAEVAGPAWAADFPLATPTDPGGPPGAARDAARDAAPSEPAPPDLDALRAEWEAEAAARLAVAVAEARAEAYAAGRADAEAEAEAARAAQREALDATAARLRTL
ncbi:MAG: hypothetical protein R3362_09420, partial [Rhodothermales bacterium]|nr:hypothetical protein [Rhodothermales bacterium]